MIAEETRIKGLKHVLYEFWQIELCAKKLSYLFKDKPVKNNEDECERNSYVESFLVHLRAIKDFLEGAIKTPDLRDPSDLNK